jgi:hypothetical protein
MNIGNNDEGPSGAIAQELASSNLSNRLSHIDRAQAKLVRRLNSAGMSPEGESWLIAALDPYHDEALSLSGYPDGSRTRSIVQVVKRDLDIRPPASFLATLAPGETWDAHIFNMPNILGETAALETPTTSASSWWTALAGSTAIFDVNSKAADRGPGNVNVIYVKTGTPSWCKGRNYPGTGTNVAPTPDECYLQSTSPDYQVSGTADLAAMSSDYTLGLHRIIAQDFELANVSKVLDMEGTITVYAQNSRHSSGAAQRYGVGSGILFGVTNVVHRCTGPPATADDALNLPGSRLWHSKYGAYVVPRLQEVEIPYTSYAPAESIWDGATETALSCGGVPADVQTSVCLSTTRITGPGVSSDRPCLNRSFDFTKAQHGIYITGQSTDAKFKLTCRWIIESANLSTKPGLVVLQPPSPAFDPIARAVYSEALRLAPPGVRLDENAFGTWFREAASRVLSTVKPMAMVAAPALATAFTGNPLAGALAADMISRFQSREPQKLKKKLKKEEKVIEKLIEPRRRRPPPTPPRR